MVQRLWRRYAPYWHIFTVMLGIVFASALWISDVRSYGPRITALEKKQGGLDEIRFNLKNVAERLGVRYIERDRE